MAVDKPTNEQDNNEQEYTWLQEQLRNAVIQEGEGLEEVGEVAPMALLQAAEAGDVEVFLGLLELCPSININAPGPDGDTALHLACLYGQLEFVTALLEKGADVGTINSEDGSSALHDAAAGGYFEICKLLIEKGKVVELLSTVDEDGDTPLHHAARGDHLDIVKFFVGLEADPTKRNKNGNTPAQESDDEDIKKYLQAVVADRIKLAMQTPPADV